MNTRQFVFNRVPRVCGRRNQFHFCGAHNSPGLTKGKKASMLEVLPSCDKSQRRWDLEHAGKADGETQFEEVPG